VDIQAHLAGLYLLLNRGGIHWMSGSRKPTFKKPARYGYSYAAIPQAFAQRELRFKSDLIFSPNPTGGDPSVGAWSAESDSTLSV
jgi:hypothetical protein